MPLVSQTISALFNGVSQQATAVRDESQSEEMVNCLPTIVKGVGRRPPAQFITQLLSGITGTNLFVHFIDRSKTEKYVVVIDTTTVYVWDLLTGTQKTVTNASGSYLATANPKEDLQAITVLDTTFIVNKKKTVAMTAAVANTGALTGTVNLFSDLPIDDPDAVPPTTISGQYKVAGSDHNNFDHYYVQGVGGDHWQEIALNGVQTTIDANTMPHVLVRQSNGTFNFGTFSWDIRQVGDDSSNPVPTFVGNTINDIFFYRNRLGLLVGENTLLSESGSYGNYWRKTTTSILDTDPIDVAASHNKVAVLNFAVPFRKNLYMFADSVQFVLNSPTVLSNESVAIDVVTTYKVNPLSRPVSSGDTLFFAADGGVSSTILEYPRADEATVVNVASNISAHVPSYIPSGVTRMTGSPNYDQLFVVPGGTNEIYVYSYHYKGIEKVQSAWHKWVFEDSVEVISAEAMDNYLYVTYKRGTALFLEKIDLEIDQVATGKTYQIHLDSQFTAAGTYDVVNDWTTWDLPYDLASGIDLEIVRDDGTIVDPAVISRPNTTQVRATGDYSGGTETIGIKYESSIELSEIFYRKQSKEPRLNGHLKLRTLSVHFTDTAYFKTEVTPYARDPLASVVIPSLLSSFTGKTIGDAALILGSPVFVSDTYKFPVFSDASTVKIRLLNDSPFASWYQKAEWEGHYTTRAHPR